MHKRALILVFLALTVVAAVLVYTIFQGNDAVDRVPANPVMKTLRFSYTITNNSADFIEDAAFMSFMPIQASGYQRIESITSSHDYTLVDEHAEQQSIQFHVANIPPYGSRVVSLTLVIKTFEGPRYEAIDTATYLKAEKYIERDSGPVTRVANSLPGDERFLEAAYQWLGNNIRDVGYVAENKGAQFALEHYWGDCTEYMYAFVALARAKGIPARGMAGFVVEDDAVLVSAVSYHNWAEYYDGQKWVLVDPQKKAFDEHYPHYIGYRTLGGEQESSTHAGRFVAIDNRLSISF